MAKTSEVPVSDVALDEVISLLRIVLEDLEGALAAMEDEEKDFWDVRELSGPEDRSLFFDSLTKVFDMRGKRKITKVELEAKIKKVEKDLSDIENLRDRDHNKFDVVFELRSKEERKKIRLILQSILGLLVLVPGSLLVLQYRERLCQILKELNPFGKKAPESKAKA